MMPISQFAKVLSFHVNYTIANTAQIIARLVIINVFVFIVSIIQMYVIATVRNSNYKQSTYRI